MAPRNKHDISFFSILNDHILQWGLRRGRKEIWGCYCWSRDQHFWKCSKGKVAFWRKSYFSIFWDSENSFCKILEAINDDNFHTTIFFGLFASWISILLSTVPHSRPFSCNAYEDNIKNSLILVGGHIWDSIKARGNKCEVIKILSFKMWTKFQSISLMCVHARTIVCARVSACVNLTVNSSVSRSILRDIQPR
jgi:hypothetical protein